MTDLDLEVWEIDLDQQADWIEDLAARWLGRPEHERAGARHPRRPQAAPRDRDRRPDRPRPAPGPGPGLAPLHQGLERQARPRTRARVTGSISASPRVPAAASSRSAPTVRWEWIWSTWLRSPSSSGSRRAASPAAETAAIMRLPADLRLRTFYECWTRKEAYLKASGAGLAGGLDSIRVTVAEAPAADHLARRRGCRPLDSPRRAAGRELHRGRGARRRPAHRASRRDTGPARAGAPGSLRCEPRHLPGRPGHFTRARPPPPPPSSPPSPSSARPEPGSGSPTRPRSTRSRSRSTALFWSLFLEWSQPLREGSPDAGVHGRARRVRRLLPEPEAELRREPAPVPARGHGRRHGGGRPPRLPAARVDDPRRAGGARPESGVAAPAHRDPPRGQRRGRRGQQHRGAGVRPRRGDRRGGVLHRLSGHGCPGPPEPLPAALPEDPDGEPRGGRRGGLHRVVGPDGAAHAGAALAGRRDRPGRRSRAAAVAARDPAAQRPLAAR